MSVVLNDVTSQRRAERQLRHDAFHDALTGLPNRALFADRVENALARADRSGRDAAVLFIDLDDFKTVNDSLGHTAGDNVLMAIGQRIQECLRRQDTAARLGGDEFAVLIEDVTDPSVPDAVAERVLGVLNRSVPVAGYDLDLSASVGLAIACPGDTSDDLLRNADAAMYEAKRAGKNRTRHYTPQLHDHALSRLSLRSDLAKALSDEQLSMHYQPIVELDTGKILGLEALVRWTHPLRGDVSPAEFIPLAEETGQIAAIGKWVMQKSLLDASMLRARLGQRAPGYMSINVSAKQLLSDVFLDDVEAALAIAHSDVEVVFEITETAVMSDVDKTVKALQRLRDLGIRLAIDDFGTGYSSMAYLQQLPIDVIKIDRSFIKGMRSDHTALVTSMLQIADSLGLQAVAEGVETDEQRRLLMGLACAVGQGYHFARPAEIDEVIDTIESASPVRN